MTNLEFIEEKIENIKFSLERLKSHDLNDPYLKHLFEENNKDLNILEQIKSELEAWEDKKTPKKVSAEWRAGYDPQLYYPKSFYCPSCTRRLKGNQSYKYCPKCGQALDWIYI